MTVTSKKQNILYISAGDNSGYATAAKSYVYELDKTNAVCWRTFSDSPLSTDSEFDSVLIKCKTLAIKSCDTAIIHYIPTDWDYLLRQFDVIQKTNIKTIIGRTVWEFDILPIEWVNAINNSIVTHVSVPTEWNKNTFIKCGVKKPVLVEPHPFIEYNNKNYDLVHFINKDKNFDSLYELDNISEIKNNYSDHFVFYNISAYHSRKSIDETVECFCKSFFSNDNVILLIKISSTKNTIEDKIILHNHIYNICRKYDHAPIFLIKEELSSDEIRSLHKISDCYFSLTKTEGFGIGIHDAYKGGNAVIAPNYSGYTEFLPVNYSGLLPYKLESVSSDFRPLRDIKFTNEYKWAIVNESDVIEKLKDVVRNDTIKKDIEIKENPLSILYVGQYGTSGYATAAKQYIANYVMQGTPIRWEPLYFDTSTLDASYVNILATSAINKEIEYNTVILHSTPDLWPIYIKKNSASLRNKKIIGYTTWETNVLPKDWVTAINSVSEVFVPSEYNYDVFIENGVNIPIKVVPHLFFGTTLPSKSDIKIKGAKDGYCTFYNLSELNERKNIKELVTVFCESFKNTDKVQLILKLHYKDYNSENERYCKQQIKKITDKYPNHANIVIITRNLTDIEVSAIHAYSDCYISLTRSEGFGLPIFYAYKYGKDVIVTNYGGHLDYLKEDSTRTKINLVNCSLVDVSGMNTFNSNYNHPNQKWAQPDLKHAKKLIKEYYKKR